MPWFDYWIPFAFIFAGKKVFYMKDEAFYHIKHWNDRNEDIWIKFGEYFCMDMIKFTDGDIMKYFNIRLVAEKDKKLSEATVNYGEIVHAVMFFIKKHSESISVSKIKMNINFHEIYERTKNFRPIPNYPTYPPYHRGKYLEEYFLDYFKYLRLKFALKINTIIIFYLLKKTPSIFDRDLYKNW